ncbi:hypothetical protein Vadar_029061 [Vaccinium darrowii]|uniref:Uncharacterized protein n=1 Tax=Vaccinium darrowii TaxID=229202 RepID=A0ACB7YZC0_9ERIC|nr:hypothetical protein Vadar_029061 [Vaccinium darrowii]
MLSSVRWGYFRIITGTIVGGVLGFYVMHRLEVSYKEKWNERLKKYEEELNKKKEKANKELKTKYASTQLSFGGCEVSGLKKIAVRH